MKRFLSLLFASTLAACGGGGGGNGNGPGAQSYFGLAPGVCFDFKSDGGDIASVEVNTVINPPGIYVEFALSGVLVEKDFLALDAGNAFLAERIYATPSGNLSDVFSDPLLYLSAPVGTDAVVSTTSPYMEGNASGTRTMGIETLSVNESAATATWSGFGAKNSASETKIDFTFTEGDGGGGTVVTRWVAPGLGFTDLYMANSLGIYVDYLLTGSHPDDAGCP